MDPISAATHPAPYPCYAELRARGGMRFDSDLQLWIASSAAAVAAVLNHGACRVRPEREPIPGAIAGGMAGRVFGQLMRMNDGERQRCPRAAIEPGLQQVSPEEIEQRISALLPSLPRTPLATRLSHCQWRLPVSVIVGLLGFPSERLADIARLTRDFVACLSPLSTQRQLDAAHRAAERLSGHFAERLRGQPRSPLLEQMLQRFARADRDSLIANLIGLLAQTCEASAGLIGNSLIALRREPGLLTRLQAAPELSGELLAEVQRHDPSVHSTRRFVTAPCTIAGASLQPGDNVLVLLAAANRDPQLNPEPDRLLLQRAERRSFSFGAGVHHCPGQRIALAIGTAIVRSQLRHPPLADSPLDWHYQSSLNGRLPLFGERAQVQA